MLQERTFAIVLSHVSCAQHIDRKGCPAMLPLAGVRIIAVEQYGAGPFGSMLLGDLGAEVIKIENPAEGGDVGRAVGPHTFGPGDRPFFQARNTQTSTMPTNCNS